MNAIEELADATPEDQRRLDALRALLHGRPECADKKGRAPTVRIYCFRDVWGGVRISEIGLSWKNEDGTYGSTWMAGDMDSFPVIYAAERYLGDCLHDVEDHGGGSVYDPEQEARRGLLYWLMPKPEHSALPEWDERESNPLAA